MTPDGISRNTYRTLAGAAVVTFLVGSLLWLVGSGIADLADWPWGTTVGSVLSSVGFVGILLAAWGDRRAAEREA